MGAKRSRDNRQLAVDNSAMHQTAVVNRLAGLACPADDLRMSDNAAYSDHVASEYARGPLGPINAD